MSDNGFRVVSLNGVVMITIAMFIAGMPLTMIVGHQVYGQAMSVNPGGDYRGWVMAHLEGLLNGILIIGFAAATRVRAMTARRDKVLKWALLVMAWCNTIASILAPILNVRGMAMNADPANNAVTAIFTLGFVATFVVLWIMLWHLSASLHRSRVAAEQATSPGRAT